MLGWHGQALARIIWEVVNDNFWSRVHVLSAHLDIFFLSKMLPDRLPRLKEEGSLYQMDVMGSVFLFWPPLS